MRHGESMGNVDENLFTVMPDWKIPLSEKGKAQARQAGHKIQHLLPPEVPLVVYVSPYVRTKETLQEVTSVLQKNHPILFIREEPRLREQDFGNFQDYEFVKKQKKERPQFGRFFYRFHDGESGADVFDRVSAFLGTFHRDMAQVHSELNVDMDNAAALFVTHGITARLLLMRWLHWSVDEFEALHNPPNTGILHLQRDGSIYRLCRESTALIKAPNDSGGALQIGFQLKRSRESSDRAAFAALVDSARGT